MERVREAQALLELCQDQQRILAGLYQAYAFQFPSATVPWTRLADELLADASLMDAFKEGLETGAIQYTPGGLRQDGLEKVLLGRTTPEEVRAATSR